MAGKGKGQVSVRITAWQRIAAVVAIACMALPGTACAATPGGVMETTRPHSTDVPDHGVDDVSDSSARERAVAVAEQAMVAFSRPTLPYEQWWAELSPLLDPAAVEAYAYTDPSQVPASRVTGDGQVSAAPSATEITVLVPTDVGQYRVRLYRQSAADDQPWLVHSLTPPELP